MFDSDQDKLEQSRKNQWKNERQSEDKSQGERRYTGRGGKGQREGDVFGSISGVKNIGGRGKYVNRGRGGRGRGRRGRGRGWREGNRERGEAATIQKYRKTLQRRIQLVEQAYSENTNANIRKIIQQLEEKATQGQSDSEMEDWEYLLPDPGNTRGHMTLYKQALHVYWVMKRLLAKAMEQVAMEMAELAQGIPNLKREMKDI